jgi:hypothetical protein
MTARYGTCSTGAKSRPRGGSFSTSIWSTPSAKRIASSTSCSRFPDDPPQDDTVDPRGPKGAK